MPLVEVYSKNDCHLCEVLKEQLSRLNQILSFELKFIDINDDPEHFEKFKYDIPVVYINGTIAFKHRMDEQEFMKKLAKRK